MIETDVAYDRDEERPSPFRDDFENSGGPLSNPFDRTPFDDSSTEILKSNPAGLDLYSFGFNQDDGLFGDDPTIESGPNFGKVD